MSMRALLQATKTAIHTHLGISASDDRDAICDVTDDGRPKPVSGQIFYGIVGNTIVNTLKEGRDDEYDLRVIITLRADYCPGDRVGTELLLQAASGANTGGLWARAEALAAVLHMNYALMNDANTNGIYGIGGGADAGGTANGFDEPLTLSRIAYLGAKGPDWFDAEGHDDAITGVAIEVLFNRARRVQTIESDT